MQKVTFVIRWFPEFEGTLFQRCLKPSCTVSLLDIILPHMACFAYWQLSYYLKTEIIDRDKMSKRQDIITSFRYLTKDTNSKIYKFVNMYGPQYRVYMFICKLKMRASIIVQ